ncbi:MAG: Mu transposase C-terminal domain-containing protein [Planctomycetes bacterium]|nr:Mu transposase C-terminal domain-containing protein [Planctomycetota bacterium]
MRQAVKDELLLLCEGRGVYKVGGNGVAFTVGSQRLTYGANCYALDRYRGRKVFITLDPDDVSHCYAWTAERENREPSLKSDTPHLPDIRDHFIQPGSVRPAKSVDVPLVEPSLLPR